MTYPTQAEIREGKHLHEAFDAAINPVLSKHFDLFFDRAKADLVVANWMRAHLARLDAPAPRGWQVVPVEPTEEMLRAARIGMRDYRAMLAAAPQPEAEQCDNCDGTGKSHYFEETCRICSGTGLAPPDADVEREMEMAWINYADRADFDPDLHGFKHCFVAGYRAAIAALGPRSEREVIRKVVFERIVGIDCQIIEKAHDAADDIARALAGEREVTGDEILERMQAQKLRALAGEPG